MEGANKDLVNVMYLGVSFKGEAGGRLSLQSNSMVYFSASGERKADIPWSSIGRLQTGAIKSTATNTEEFTLTLIMTRAEQESLIFGLKTEEDLDCIRSDIQGLVKTCNTHKAAAAAAAPAAFGKNKPGENLSAAPTLESSLAVVSNHGGCPPGGSLVGSQKSAFRSHSSMKSFEFHDEKSLASPSRYSVRTKPTENIAGESRAGAADEASVWSTASTRSSSTIHSGDMEAPAVATMYSSCNTRPVKDNWRKAFTSMKESAEMPPLATYRLIPNQHDQRLPITNTYIHSTKQITRPPRKFWQSKWFWLVIVLLILLMIGIGIVIGILTEEATLPRAVVGMEDITVAPQPAVSGVLTSDEWEPSTFSPTDYEVLAASEGNITVATAAPTTAPTENSNICDGIPHGQLVNSRDTAIEVGAFGGSPQCRASMISICEPTDWVQWSTFTGTGSVWFKATAIDDSFCHSRIEHLVALLVPTGLDYDLHVYPYNSPVAQDAAINEGEDGELRTVTISTGEEFGVLGDDSYTYYIHVEYRSGGSCQPWKLDIHGHQCLSSLSP